MLWDIGSATVDLLTTAYFASDAVVGCAKLLQLLSRYPNAMLQLAYISMVQYSRYNIFGSQPYIYIYIYMYKYTHTYMHM